MNSNSNHSHPEDDCDHFKVYRPIYVACFIFIVTGILAYNMGTHVLESESAKAETKITFIVGFLVYIGVIVSFIGVIFQNRYRINIEVLSKNRQEWINDLRVNLSEYLNLTRRAIYEAHYMKKDYDMIMPSTGEDEQSVCDRKNSFVMNNWYKIENLKFEFMQRYYYIKLLLGESQQRDDSDKILAKKLIEQMDNIKKQAFICNIDEYVEFPEIVITEVWDEAVLRGEMIIKKEWIRVKRGR